MSGFYYHFDADSFEVDWNLVYNSVNYATVACGYCPNPEHSRGLKTLYDCRDFLGSILCFGERFDPVWNQTLFLAALSFALPRQENKPVLYYKNSDGNVMYIEFVPGSPSFTYGTARKMPSTPDISDRAFWNIDGYDLTDAGIFG